MSFLGVGFLGAGIASQAIHIPTLAAFADRARVTWVMDIDAVVAEAVAAAATARCSTNIRDVLDDPETSIIVVASPAAAHADQVVAACAAGKRVILCEKPLAVTLAEAERIERAAAASGTVIVVGTMHAYDRACRAALDAWRRINRPAALVRSKIYLGTDDDHVRPAAQVLNAPPPWPVPTRPWTDSAAAAFIDEMMLGLTIHDIPIIREIVPSLDTLDYVSLPGPIAYAIAAIGSGCVVEMLGLVEGQWDASWTLDAISPIAKMHIEFPPSFVHSGSSVARVSYGGMTREWRYANCGYCAEWEHVLDIADGKADPAIPLRTAIEDLALALKIGTDVGEFVKREGL